MHLSEYEEHQGIEFISSDAEKLVSLQGVRINSIVKGFVEKTTVDQVFSNNEDIAIEITYTFPLPPDASICGFEVITEDRVLTGAIEDSEKAFDIYNESVDDGHAAFRIDQHRPDIFTVHVGNINPGQTALMRIEYVRMLKPIDGCLQLVYPTTVASRFITDTGARNPSQSMADGEMINSPLVNDMRYGLTLNVTIGSNLPVTKVTSDTHNVLVEKSLTNESEPSAHTISLSRGITEMNRDLLIDIELKTNSVPVSVIEKGVDDKSFLALNFLPDFDNLPIGTSKQNTAVFVVDCSGSMQGSSIEQARSALTLCLRSLSEGDRFLLVKFGCDYETHSQKLISYNAQSLQDALIWIENLDSDMGGTELYTPFEAIYAATEGETCVDIVLLTDGHVSNDAAIITLADRYKNSHRVFTFGIGSSASRHLCTGLAEATQGAAEFIHNRDRIEPKVLRTFSRIASPALGNVAIRQNGQIKSRVIWATPDMPPLFDGDALCLLAEVTGPVPSDWTLTATHENETIEFPINMLTEVASDQTEVDQPSQSDCGISQLWATNRIKYLESQHEIQLTARHSEKTVASVSRLQSQIVRLSKAYNVLSSETSFISVAHRSIQDRNDGLPAFRQIPLMPSESALDIMPESHSESAALTVGMRACLSANSIVRSNPIRTPVSSPACYGGNSNQLSVNESALHSLLNTQQADGSFNLNGDYAEAAQAYFLTYNELELDISLLNPDELLATQNTVYALHLLESQFNNEQAQWKRAANKARHFMVVQIMEQVSLVD